jgi:hypothetical protein
MADELKVDKAVKRVIPPAPAKDDIAPRRFEVIETKDVSTNGHVWRAHQGTILREEHFGRDIMNRLIKDQRLKVRELTKEEAES